MKIFLCQAPYYVAEAQRLPYYVNANPEPNLGLSDLAAFLIGHGHEDVEIKNFCIDSWDVVTEHLKGLQSRGKNLIVGINCFSDTRFATFELARLAKRIIPECTVIVGGVHASIMYESILKNNPAIDAIVVGEGEFQLLEITESMKQGKPLSEDIGGIALRRNSNIVFTGRQKLINDLDKLPMTAHHLYDINALRWNNDFNPLKNIAMKFIPQKSFFAPKIWYMNTSRGCPGKCRFCTGNRIWQGTWRARSAKRVVDEMEYLQKSFGVNLISFFDACFATSAQRVKKICEEIVKRDLTIYWICLTRVDNIDDIQLLQSMRKAGCLGICFGIESGSPTILRNINKNCDIARAKNAIHMTKISGIKAFTFYIVGNYGETDQTIKETIDFIKEVKSDIISVGYNIVFPGTELHDVAKTRGWIDDSLWDNDDYAPRFTYQHSSKKLTSYKNEILFAHFSSKLISGDFSSLRLYFFTRPFLSYVIYKLKLGWLVDIIKRSLTKNNIPRT